MSDPGIALPGDLPRAATAVSADRLPLWRRLSQFAMLGLLGQWSIYGVVRCPFPVPYISCQNCPVITCYGRLTTLFWGFWLLLPVSVLLFGRAYCGWGCPGGLANQLLGKIAPAKLRIRNLFTRIAPLGMYLGLAIALYLVFALSQPRANVPIRVGGFFESVTLTFEHAGRLWVVRTAVVLGFLASGLVVAGAWCRFACPSGGVLEALKRVALFRFYKTDKCNDCDRCLKVCEMGTRPDESNCTNCGDCRSVCPTGAIEFGRKKPH